MSAKEDLTQASQFPTPVLTGSGSTGRRYPLSPPSSVVNAGEERPVETGSN